MAGTPPADVERQVAFDMIRRGLPVLPIVVALALLARGPRGGLSATLAIAVVVVNLVVAAALLTWAAGVSLAFLMGAALGGFVVRMALVVVALAVARHQSFIDMTTFGLTIVVTHLGLLAWETRYVSLSLAFPGLKPTPTSPGG